MILFFGNPTEFIYAVLLYPDHRLSQEDVEKMIWLFKGKEPLSTTDIEQSFIGPRSAMITPWSTNAVEITQNMGISGIKRIEKFFNALTASEEFDPMISQKYHRLDQNIFTIDIAPEQVLQINDIADYNTTEGLSLSAEEVQYLEEVADRIGRPLTDSEVFGFSQVNSEHCRHKIFNGIFIIDGKEKELSLFKLIKKTSKEHPNTIVSAYKDNVAFIKGPKVTQFAPERADIPDTYVKKSFDSVISLKAETHNFPTTVEPFNGAATGAGGEIRDRLAGGKGSLPLAGTAVYMTSYSRLAENRPWESKLPENKWLYQSPLDILIKASNGASDFGNKFGQPLISGSLLTFEHVEHNRNLGYDKVIMLAGGIGYGKQEQALKDTPSKGDKIVILGGDNYRIGMGGAAVSSVDTGQYGSGIELNAVQRSNPEMQKRAANVIRGMVESSENPIVSIHDHGAGGHLNCLSELVEDTGGKIQLDTLPIGDPTLSDKEIIGNESQERMGLVIGQDDIELLDKIATRERAPMYTVGEVTGDKRFSFVNTGSEIHPVDLALSDLFGSSPKTIMEDRTIERHYLGLSYDTDDISTAIIDVLKLEAVACKDWLTNKVDRCVGGRVAKQQCCGPLQLPLNNVGVMALDYDSTHGVATAIGHAPISSLVDPAAGARNSIAESLTNIIWAPLEDGLTSVSLSANWMWPCRNEGEDARLYEAVEAVSEFSIALGINIPTGKDSLSMKQKYADKEVLSPGTVIITAGAHCDDINRIVEPVLHPKGGLLYYINLSQDNYHLGGSSFAQTKNTIGSDSPDIKNPTFFKKAFNVIQELIKEDKIIAGHDISSGGLITTLLELCFSQNNVGANIFLDGLREKDTLKLLFSENAGIVIQARDTSITTVFDKYEIENFRIGEVTEESTLSISNGSYSEDFDIAMLRDIWYETSYLLDQHQSGEILAKERFDNYKNQPLAFSFPLKFKGNLPDRSIEGSRPIAAILREKGCNSEREMAHALYLAGFDVRDVHMTDLITGRENLEDVQFLGAVGGFSNSDVLGSAKGWAGAIKFNKKAKSAIDNFFAREDVLSIGICNGCQLMMELDLINPEHEQKALLIHNDSNKHESAFTSVRIQDNPSIMLSSLAGTTLGVWISHGEGKFDMPQQASDYNIVGTYGYASYPSNPNGSNYNTAMLCSNDGRHLVTMPHIERSVFKWNWAFYPERRNDIVSPWLDAFVNARNWIIEKNSSKN